MRRIEVRRWQEKLVKGIVASKEKGHFASSLV